MGGKGGKGNKEHSICSVTVELGQKNEVRDVYHKSINKTTIAREYQPFAGVRGCTRTGRGNRENGLCNQNSGGLKERGIPTHCNDDVRALHLKNF